MDWTTPADIKRQLHRFWSHGRILAAQLDGAPLFPLRLRLNKPDTNALSERFGEVRTWIRNLEEGSKSKLSFGFEIEWVEIQHRQLGRNRVPSGIRIPTTNDAFSLLGKNDEAAVFTRLANTTLARFPELRAWIARKPLTLIESAGDWASILAVMEWFREHPRPGIYLRQLDIPGVDTKFIENHKGLMSELLDLILSADAIETQFPPSNFELRYRLAVKPPLIRFRVLDRRLAIGGLTDLTVPAGEFAGLDIPVQKVFITENEINGLAFPDVLGSLVVFGLGYGVQRLSDVPWLAGKAVHYWGDIDTHGFAILDRLRAALPHAQSFLMDRDTLMSHRKLWVHENERYDRALTRLACSEQSLFDDLRHDRLGERVRLEQERISFGLVSRALQAIAASD